MKAVLLTNIGDSNNLRYSTINQPTPRKNEESIKVLYCGINHLDLLIRQGKRPGPSSFPHILGSEVVGITKNGTLVAVYPWTFCGKCNQCKLGNENMCDLGGTLGRTTWGGYSQYVNVPIHNIVKLSPKVPLEKVTASLLASTAALHLISRAGISDKSTVLVTGATGGVGTSVIQLLTYKKCTVIAATSHKEKHQYFSMLSVNKIVSTKQLTQDVLALYPQGVEYVVDIMGGSVWSGGLEVLAKNGTLVFCSSTLEEPGIVSIGKAFSKQVNIFGSYGGTMKEMRTVIKLIDKGTLDPVIDTVYSLKDAPIAHKKMEEQKIFGKLLLKVY